MASDIPAVRERLKALLETVDGTKTVFMYTPRSIEEAHCPAWLMFPAAGEHTFNTNSNLMVVRLWRLVLAVGKVGVGAYGDLEKTLDPFFERTEDLFCANYMLDSLDSELEEAVIVDDTGPGEFPFPPGSDARWFGAEWHVAIVTKRAVTTGL